VTLDLLLVGFGNVARRFVSLLDEQRDRLAREHDFSARIIGITTRRHGQAFSARGLHAAALAARVARGGAIGSTLRGAGAAVSFIRDAAHEGAAAALQRRLVVVETTTLDIARGEPAISHVRTALACGAHVVTANKGPAAFAYRALARAAARANRRFLFEGAVMDGVPIFNLVRESLPAVQITSFRGVVNSTTNYMMTAMEQGQSFDAALAEMQARGIAEADASLDVDGWDAAAKTAALANVLLETDLTPRLIERQGITPDTAKRARAAMRAGRRLKLVARANRNGLQTVPYTLVAVGDGPQTVPTDSHAIARVALEELPADDLLAGVDGQQNALILETDLLGEIAIVQRGGGLTQTAYALLSDLVTIAREVKVGTGRATRRVPTQARRGRIR
jgi:homoserine dehydrogenase